MTLEMAMNDSVDSLPPTVLSALNYCCRSDVSFLSLPFRIAAFPDLIAKDAMLAITSGRASNIINSTPIGQLTRSNINPSSNRVFKVDLPTYCTGSKSMHHSVRRQSQGDAFEFFNLIPRLRTI